MWTSVTSFLWVNIDFRGEGQRHLAKTPIGHDGESCAGVSKYHLSTVVRSFDFRIFWEFQCVKNGIFVSEINRNRTSNACSCCYYLMLVGKSRVLISSRLSHIFWELADRDWLVYIFPVPSTAAFSYNGMVVSPPLVNLLKYSIRFRALAPLMSWFSTLRREWRRSEGGLDFSIWSSWKWILQKVIWQYLTTILFSHPCRDTPLN